MSKMYLKKGYEEKEIIHNINPKKKRDNSETISKMGKMPNTPELKVKIVHDVKGKDIGNSPQKIGDLSSFDSCGGDVGCHIENLNGGGGTRGIADEEEEPWS